MQRQASVGDTWPTSSWTPDHGGPRPEWHPLVLEDGKAESIWQKLSEFPRHYDRLTHGKAEEFKTWLLDRHSAFWEFQDERGLAAATNLVPGHTATVHVFFFDHKLKGKGPVLVPVLEEMFGVFHLRRLTVSIPKGQIALRDLFRKVGFKYEGCQREGALREGQIRDLELFGCLRGELRCPQRKLEAI